MNAFSLHNKTALITGAASGLGLAMAKCMIVSGAKVIIADLNGELAQATAGTLKSQASWIQMDVGDTAAARKKLMCLLANTGLSDILVNNAGNHCKPIEEMSVSDFESVLDVHVVGAFALTKALVPHMKQRGKGCVLYCIDDLISWAASGYWLQRSEVSLSRHDSRYDHGACRSWDSRQWYCARLDPYTNVA